MNGEIRITPTPIEEGPKPRAWPMKRMLVVAVVGVLAVGGAAAWLFAAPTIGAVNVTPSVIGVNTPTIVTITAQITDASLIPTSVNLLRVDAAGKVVANLGTMYDNGTNGDVVAGDKTFSRAVALSEAVTGEFRFQISAAFRGVLKRALSPIVITAIWRMGEIANIGSVMIPPEWRVTTNGTVSELTNTVSERSMLSDEALAAESSYYIERLPNANPDALTINQWFDRRFADGFHVPPDYRIDTSVDGHSAVKIQIAEIGPTIHYYIEDGLDIVSIIHRAFPARFANSYDLITSTLRIHE